MGRITSSFGYLAWTVLAYGQTVTLTPSPTSLTFSYVTGSALPAAQTASVKASTGTPTFSVSVTGANSLWLTATPDSGKMPANLSIRVNPTGLSVGTYTAAVVLSASGTANTASIPVNLTVTSPLPTLALSAASLTFSSPPLQPAPQVLHLGTSGGPISFTAAASGAWLTVSPSAGVVLPGQQTVVTVSVDASAVVPQATPYAGKITIVASGVPAANKTQNVNVSLTANSSTPTVTSLWPPGVQVNSPATTVTIRGTNFYVATVVKIAGPGTALATTVLSSTALLAVIPAASLATAGSLGLIVSNPSPGGDSLSVPLLVASTPVVQAIVSAASNVGTAVSPGELVTLYGANIGPSTPSLMQDANADGFVDTSSAGVSVAIDGQPAPLIYAGQNQISVQVPYEATIGTAKTVAVTNGSIVAFGQVDIVAAAPGVFTLDGTGIGQAAALNYNSTSGLYSLNLAASPAKPGDTILLYITGEGDFANTISPRTGLLVPPTLSPLPQITPLPVVTIGGALATLQYAGPLVGSILGLTQLNVTIPAGSTTGTAVPVVVSVGGVASQTGVTLSIHP